MVGAVAVLLGGTLVAAAQTLPGRMADAPEPYCETARGAFERTSKWARELAGTLESLDADGPDATATRLLTIRQGLANEATVLTSHSPPAGAEDVREHGTATVELLLGVADPSVVHTDDEARDQTATFIRDQFVAARTEARAAAAALRQHEPNCPGRRPNSGVWQLLGLGK